MKKGIVLGVIFFSFLISCHKSKQLEEAASPNVSIEKDVKESILEECYTGVIKNDSISVILKIENEQYVSGKLRYNFYEKDKNNGTLVGEIKGDTLYAAYTFMSEGLVTVRQVVFLKKGNTYVEGYGDVVDNKGKVTFKDRKQLKFNVSVVLSKVNCIL
ncbi:hypothetical protein [Flavobacterium sp. LS1R10]|uniref:hypothetical protein n=1 Tax=Flavobacterium sp. LS1R10 TaxID=2497482 RepID=UPI000F831901|nr:hypothetical protein [Flavobacterium sp. LS1R10]RTY74558.1 hypothetical protein EKL96_07265 [Flavobacterium sp. LS1R10]